MSDLIGNPEDRFSHNEAPIMLRQMFRHSSANFDVGVKCLRKFRFLALFLSFKRINKTLVHTRLFKNYDSSCNLASLSAIRKSAY